jgi:hypothetical protein
MLVIGFIIIILDKNNFLSIFDISGYLNQNFENYINYMENV